MEAEYVIEPLDVVDKNKFIAGPNPIGVFMAYTIICTLRLVGVEEFDVIWISVKTDTGDIDSKEAFKESILRGMFEHLAHKVRIDESNFKKLARQFGKTKEWGYG